MKKVLSLFLALVMCLSLCACSRDESLFKEHLKDKKFESDGRTLSFYDKNLMSYHFINGMGDEFFYVYEVKDIEEKEGELHFTLVLSDANDYSEIIEEEEKDVISYNIENNTIEYYGQLYS